MQSSGRIAVVAATVVSLAVGALGQVSVAVMPFESAIDATIDEMLAGGAPAAIISALSTSSNVRLIETPQIAKLVGELQTTDQAETAEALVGKLSARLVVFGLWERRDDIFRLRIRAIDTQRDSAGFQFATQGKDPFDVQERAAQRVLQEFSSMEIQALEGEVATTAQGSVVFGLTFGGVNAVQSTCRGIGERRSHMSYYVNLGRLTFVDNDNVVLNEELCTPKTKIWSADRRYCVADGHQCVILSEHDREGGVARKIVVPYEDLGLKQNDFSEDMVCWSPDGVYLLAGTRIATTADLIDGKGGTGIVEIGGLPGRVTSGIWSPNSAFVLLFAVEGKSGHMCLYALDGGTKPIGLLSVEPNCRLRSPVWGPAGASLAVLEDCYPTLSPTVWELKYDVLAFH